jgi:hypothetical protein
MSIELSKVLSENVIAPVVSKDGMLIDVNTGSPDSMIAAINLAVELTGCHVEQSRDIFGK